MSPAEELGELLLRPGLAREVARALFVRQQDEFRRKGLSVPPDIVRAIAILQVLAVGAEVSPSTPEVSPPEDGIRMSAAAELTGLTPQRLRRIAGSTLLGVQDSRGHWIVSRAAVEAYRDQRERAA